MGRIKGNWTEKRPFGKETRGIERKNAPFGKETRETERKNAPSERKRSVFNGALTPARNASGGKVDAKEKNGKIGPLLEFFRGKDIIDRNAPRRSETSTKSVGRVDFWNEKTRLRRK